MHLTVRESSIVFSIMDDLSYGHGSRELRQRVGEKLLDLLGAQHFASYVWDAGKDGFTDRVAINMSDHNLQSYETYFQFCDPITPVLQRRRKATCVSEIMPRRQFVRTEFFNDFLSRDGLHFGINYYAYSASSNIGDLRIWRGSGREDFSRREALLLDAIGPAFTNAMRQALARDGIANPAILITPALDVFAAEKGLTAREKEICAAVLNGMPDREIAAHVGIAFTTVRTHLKHIYQKADISRRSQLAGLILDGHSRPLDA